MIMSETVFYIIIIIIIIIIMKKLLKVFRKTLMSEVSLKYSRKSTGGPRESSKQGRMEVVAQAT